MPLVPPDCMRRILDRRRARKMAGRSKPTEFYLKAARAFKRIHLYPNEPGNLVHEKFMAGWQQGYMAAKREARRAGSASSSQEK